MQARTAAPRLHLVRVSLCEESRRLTVKLRGRTEARRKRRGRTLSPRARGAKPQAPHGPLERLLGISIVHNRYP